MNGIASIHDRFTAHVRLRTGPRRAGEIFWETHYFLRFLCHIYRLLLCYFPIFLVCFIFDYFMYPFAVYANMKVRTDLIVT